MDEKLEETLESQMGDLVNGGLEAQQRLELLARIARDDRAREVLGEVVELQQDGRAAFGYGEADAAARASLARLRETLAGRANPLRVLWRASTVVRVAAVVVVAAAIYVAYAATQTQRAIQERLVRPEPPATMPKLTEAELATYRMVYREVVDPSQASRPWVLLSNGVGQFGYVSAAAAGAADGDELILVRCVLVGADGKSVRKMSLLVPARKEVRLSVPEAGRTDDLSIHYDVWVADQRAGVGLSVGGAAAGPAGVQGRTRIGDAPIEIGRFLLDGRELRVVLQAVPLKLAQAET